jgi:uncharacterized RDD family membrane protein YckC
MPPPPPPRAAFIVKGDDGEDYGPVSLPELRDWVRENRAGLGTTVRLDEPGSLWQPWQYYPELVALLAEAQVTGAVPGQPGLVLAPMGRRMVAFAVDLALVYILITIILITVMIVALPGVMAQLWIASSQGQYTLPQMPPLPPVYQTLFTFIMYGTVALYMAGFHWAHGKTPGKAILRLRVVNESGEKPGPSQAGMRALVLSLSLFFFFFPLIFAFLNPQRRAFHDLIAGTYVVEAATEP